MSQAYLPNIRRRLLTDPDSPYAPMGDESIMDAPPAGMGAGPYSPPASALRPAGAPTLNNGAYAPPANPAASTPSAPSPMNAYAARLGDVSKELQSAYSAPHAGMLRQVLGAFVGKRNPELGGIISGETQRARAIEPLQQEYGLIANAIAANRAAQNQEIMNRLHSSQADLYETRGNVLENPPPKPTPEEQAFDELVKGGMSRADALERIKNVKNTPAAKPSEEDKAISDLLNSKKWQDTPANRDKARSLLKTRDRKPVDDELTDINKKLKQAQLEKAMEATPDEQRRADLSTNLEENLGKLEDIARRRPELFGPLAGRMTGVRQWVGTDDPDVASLKNIEEQTGLAMVGAHAMRNAQHAEKAAQSITGANKNTASALLAPNGPIATARQSIQTFKEDAQRRRNAIEGTPVQSGGGKYARPKPNVVVEQ